MKMMVPLMLLLASAAALPVSPSTTKLANLKGIIDHARKVKVSHLTQFVSDVKQKHNCKDLFFYKVCSILAEDFQNFTSGNEKGLLENLKMFNEGKCSGVPRNTTQMVQMSTLIEDLIACSQKIYLKYNITQSPKSTGAR